jgi:hypothetical protein
VSDRERRAGELLSRAGFPGARLSSAGPTGDVAAISVAPGERHALLGPAGRELIRRIRALGYRYVTLEIGPAAGAE